MLTKDFCYKKFIGKDVYLEDQGIVMLYDYTDSFGEGRFMRFPVDHNESRWAVIMDDELKSVHRIKASDIMSAYNELLFMDNQKTRNDKIKRIKKAISESNKGETK